MTAQHYVFGACRHLPDGYRADQHRPDDLYKRGCFVVEAKQGTTSSRSPTVPAEPLALRKGPPCAAPKGWDVAMLKAKGQAEQYARGPPRDEGCPLPRRRGRGHALSCTAIFPAPARPIFLPRPRSHGIPMADLAKDKYGSACACLDRPGRSRPSNGPQSNPRGGRQVGQGG